MTDTASLSSGEFSSPVSQARHDLGFDIPLDIRPGLAILGCLLRQELLQVTRLNIGYDAAVFNGVVVIDNLANWLAGQVLGAV